MPFALVIEALRRLRRLFWPHERVSRRWRRCAGKIELSWAVCMGRGAVQERVRPRPAHPLATKMHRLAVCEVL